MSDDPEAAPYSFIEVDNADDGWRGRLRDLIEEVLRR